MAKQGGLECEGAGKVSYTILEDADHDLMDSKYYIQLTIRAIFTRKENANRNTTVNNYPNLEQKQIYMKGGGGRGIKQWVQSRSQELWRDGVGIRLASARLHFVFHIAG